MCYYFVCCWKCEVFLILRLILIGILTECSNLPECDVVPFITHNTLSLSARLVLLNSLTLQMKAVLSLETPGNTKPTTKRHDAFSAAPLCIPHVSHSTPFLLPSLNFRIIRLARIQLQFETLGIDAYICTYIYIYTFYRIFIWVLYLLGREKESVYVYTFCRCIRVIVCFPIIMLWTNLRFRHIANALSQEVFQELVSFCMPLRETNTLYDTICVGTWSLQTWPRLGQSQSACGCSFHFILWPWVKHCSVEVCVVTWDYRGA